MKRLAILLLGFPAFACAPDDRSSDIDGSAPRPAVAEEPAAPAAAGRPTISEIPPAIDVTAEQIAYGATPERNLNGFFVLPADIVEPVPGVIFIHDRWGLDDYIRAMSLRLAGEGYAVLAIDLFGGQTATSEMEADALSAQFGGDRVAVLDNITQARSFLAQNAFAPRIAVVGFGIGGAWSLEAGLALGDAVNAVVMLYGRIINDRTRLGALQAPLLGIFAAADDAIPVSDATRFRSALREINNASLVLIEPGARHGFADPSSAAYDHDAAVEMWSSVLEFLDGRLR